MKYFIFSTISVREIQPGDNQTEGQVNIKVMFLPFAYETLKTTKHISNTYSKLLLSVQNCKVQYCQLL